MLDSVPKHILGPPTPMFFLKSWISPSILPKIFFVDCYISETLILSKGPHGGVEGAKEAQRRLHRHQKADRGDRASHAPW